jgi:hypothetical protein
MMELSGIIAIADVESPRQLAVLLSIAIFGSKTQVL